MSAFIKLGRTPTPDEEQAVVPAPFFAHLYVENRCHLKCDHCYESQETHPFKGKHLSLAEWEPILDGLKDLGVMVLTFSGGEPFLRKDFDALLVMAREKRFSVRIYTSGTHIDETWADRLAELEVSDVQVSLYGATAQVHDAFTKGKNSFEKTTTGLRLLKERGVNTLMKVMVMTFNVDTLDDFCDLAFEVGCKVSFGTQVFTKVNGDVSPQQYQVSSSELAEKFFANERVSQIRQLFSKNDNGEICNGEDSYDGERRPCGAGEHIITVGADGKVYPCAIFSEAAGDATVDDIKDIWARSFLMKEVRTFRVSQFDDCESCENRKTCSPCMAQSQTHHGHLRGCNPSSKHTAVAKRLAVLRFDVDRPKKLVHPAMADPRMVT